MGAERGARRLTSPPDPRTAAMAAAELRTVGHPGRRPPVLGGFAASPWGGHLYPADAARNSSAYLAQHPGSARRSSATRRWSDASTAASWRSRTRTRTRRSWPMSRSAPGSQRARDPPGLSHLLRARAKNLVDGTLRESDALWIEAGDSPIDIAVGPYEVYDDALIGGKTAYEATIMVRHPLTQRLAAFPTAAADLVGSSRVRWRRRSPATLAVGIYDVVFTAGMGNMGGKAVAATLPNDERVRSEVGARLLLFRNVIAAKVGPILRPLGARLLRPDQIDLVRGGLRRSHAAPRAGPRPGLGLRGSATGHRPPPRSTTPWPPATPPSRNAGPTSWGWCWSICSFAVASYRPP